MKIFFQKSVNVIKSVIAILLFSRLNKLPKRLDETTRQQCIIIGNGPSLKDTMSQHSDFFQNKQIFCVNDMVLSPVFETIKPTYCIFADPLFWQKKLSPRFQKICSQIKAKLEKETNWKIIIFMPMAAKHWNNFVNLPKLNSNIKICYFNTTSVYCPKSMKHFLYRKNLAMPVVQNVLVGAIFLALNLGYKKIYIVGADHSWHENIDVDSKNQLSMIYSRFQDKGEVEKQPFYVDAEEKVPYRMYNLLRDLSRMFESYIELEDYSKNVGAKIYNASGKSYIDAFKRYTIK